MRHDRLASLGSFLVGAMIATGCGSSSSPIDAGRDRLGRQRRGRQGRGRRRGSWLDQPTRARYLGSRRQRRRARRSRERQGHRHRIRRRCDGHGRRRADGYGRPRRRLRASPATAPNNSVSIRVQRRRERRAGTTFTRDNSNTTAHHFTGRQLHRGPHVRPGSVLLATNFTAYGTINRARSSTSRRQPQRSELDRIQSAARLDQSRKPGPRSALNGVYFYMKSGAQPGRLSVRLRRRRQPGRLARVRHRSHPRSNPATAVAGVVINDVQHIGFEAYLNTAPASRRARDTQSGAAARRRHLARSAPALRRWNQRRQWPDGGGQ